MTSILALVVAETAEKILQRGLDLAITLGLPVTSWRTGDPTRSLYKYLATKLAAVDQTVANLARSAVLSLLVQAANTGDAGAIAWLKIVALEQFGIEVQEATFAQSAAGFGVDLRNTGGGNYPIDPGDVTFKSSITGKTYHNTTGGLLAPGPGTTLTLEFVADEAGSDSTVAQDDIDTLVTTYLGVVIDGSAPAIGLDEESPDSIYQRCKDSLGALSPSGPADAYRFVARNAKLTGITSITRAVSIDNENGTVTVYVAGTAGSASGGDVAAVQAALDVWSTPLTVTATAVSATGVTIAVTATVAYSGALDDAALTAAISTELAKALESIDIGGTALTTGAKGVPFDLLTAAIRSVAGVTSVSMSVPAGNTVLTVSQVPVLGAVVITPV